jgi:membrane-associated protein
VDPGQAGEFGLWYYPIMLVLLILDAAVPVMPSELLVIGAGALCSRGMLSLGPAVLAAALGCWVGDIALYALFRYGLTRWLDRYRWGRWVHNGVLRLLAAAGKSPTYAGVVAVRFIPGGIAAVPLRPFLALSALGGLLWACCMVGLGYATGETTGLPPWATALLGTAVGTLVGIGIATYVAFRQRPGKPGSAGPVPETDE